MKLKREANSFQNTNSATLTNTRPPIRAAVSTSAAMPSAERARVAGHHQPSSTSGRHHHKATATS